jgi:proline iminopeptidase
MHLHVDTLKNGEKVNVYVECSGNPNGVMVLYLHGGPGDGVSPRMRQWFNPEKYNIVLFDQRGCGKSTPRNHTEKNKTNLLISDMEKIRTRLKYSSMVVAGGSWGTALALLYAQTHPSRVSGLILRGVYDLSQDDMMENMYPENDERLKLLLKLKTKKVGEEQRKIKKVLSTKTKKRKQLIEVLADVAPAHIQTRYPHDSFQTKETLAVIGEHYESNHYFVSKKSIYKNMHKINHIPTIMIEGRYDIVTPPKIAFQLSKKFKHCELKMVNAGHASSEIEIEKGLVYATDAMLRRLSFQKGI